ncbi:MAG: hypothetical protein NC913_05900 [Candidatus Omnitrophica bacterium]|nr:hypothetical protein [Candidatus Omnitrophota bacterium]
MIKKFFLFLILSVSSGIVFCQEKKIELKDVIGEFQKNNFERVIELAERAIKEGAQQPEFYYYLAFSNMKLSKNPEAINYFRFFLKNAEYTQKNVWMLRQGLQNLASIHRNNKDFKSIVDDASVFLEKTRSANLGEQLETFCKNILVEALREIANMKAQEKDYTGAIEAYKKLLEYRPDESHVLARIAVYYKNLGQNEISAQYYLKSAMALSAWSSKLPSLVSIVELLWDTDRLNEFSKKAEADFVSYNFLLAAQEIRKKMYSEAFSRLRKLEDSIVSKGDVSERLTKMVYSKQSDDPWLLYYFIIIFPETTGSRWAADMLLNLGRNNSEIEKIIKEKMLSSLKKLVYESESTEVRRLFLKIYDMQFLGETGSREAVVERLKVLEDFTTKYPDDPIIPDVLKMQATLYVDNLSDYQKGKEIYGMLVKKYNQKSFTVQLARCLINLSEIDEAVSLIREFIADKETGENLRFQAALLLLQANFFDEGIKILKEIDEASKNRWLKQQISETMKDFRQYIKEDIAVDTTHKLIVLNLSHREYYFTNFVSIDENSPVLFQISDYLEIIPFSKKKGNISCLIECSSREEISFTQPYSMIFKKEGMYTSTMKKVISFSSDKWRRVEGILVSFPWQDVKTDKIRVIRSYKVEQDSAISTIFFEKLKPGTKIEVTFSPRAGKFESVLPESTSPGSAGAMIFNPESENFEIKVKFKAAPDLLAYYPKIRIIYEEKERSLHNSNVSSYVVSSGNVQFNVIFECDVMVHSIMKTKETIYEIDEKIDI